MDKAFASAEHLDKYASLVVAGMKENRKRSGKSLFKPGDIVLLRYWPLASALAEKVYAKLLREGFLVVLRQQTLNSFGRVFYQEANDQQLTFVAPWELELYRNLNGSISLHAPDDLTCLKDCDPAKMALSSAASGIFKDIHMGRVDDGLLGWCSCIFPTPTLAEQAGMSLEEYWQEIIKACYLDEVDPVARFYKTMHESDKIREWLNGLPIDYVRVVSKSGETDLKVWIGEQRQWLGGDGCNLPSFEIFTSPQAGRAVGTFYANEPSFRSGRLVRNVRLEFSDGRVIKVSAETEEDFVRSRVYLDDGSSMIGEFSLTDRRFSQITRFMAHTLFEENKGGENGNCHIAIGFAYPDAYAGTDKLTPELSKKLGFNQSSEHWDLVNTEEKIVTARLLNGSEIVIYKDGMFAIE